MPGVSEDSTTVRDKRMSFVGNRRSRAETAGLLSVLILSALLNSWNNDFPLGYHGDEPKKVTFIADGTQDFHHPLLILQLSRLVNLVVQTDDPQTIAQIGRWVSAFAGMGLVLMTFLIARRELSAGWSLLTALAVAVSPIMAIHAHYLKEDILFTFCALLAVYWIIRLAESPGWMETVGVGISMGLAASSHYKSVLLVGVCIAAPLLKPGQGKLGAYVMQLVIAALVAEFVFLNVNYPAIENLDLFFAGVEHETQHAREGHSLRLFAGDFGWTFHLRYSLLPGMTLGVWSLSLVGLLVALMNRGAGRLTDRLLIVYVLLYYTIPEMSPSKPAPDYARYVLQVVPPLIYFGVRLLEAVARRLPRSGAECWSVGGCALLLIAPTIDTTRLLAHMDDDTRAEIAEWLEEHAATVVFEHYAAPEYDVISLADYAPQELRDRGADFAVASSFRYERYFFGAELENQTEYMHDRLAGYRELFQLPYVEVRPTYRSYAFTNPTLRIINLRTGATDDKNRSSVNGL